MEALARQGHPVALAELSHTPPPLAAHVWRYFSELSRTRGGSGFGAAPISRMEIRLWEEDEGVTLEQWERRALLDIDAAYLAAMASHQAENSTEQPQPMPGEPAELGV